jgi:hypothetical protein
MVFSSPDCEIHAQVVEDLHADGGEAALGLFRHALHEEDDGVLFHGLGDPGVDGIVGRGLGHRFALSARIRRTKS